MTAEGGAPGPFAVIDRGRRGRVPAEGGAPGPFAVIDLETTGLDFDAPDFQITEIGACRLVPGRPAAAFQTLVAGPDGEVDTARLPEVSDDEIRSARGEAQAIAELVRFCGSLPVVAHNGIGYDFPILDRAAERCGLPSMGEARPDRPALASLEPAGSERRGHRLDSLELALLAFPRSGRSIPPDADGGTPPAGLSLDDLCRHLRVPAPQPRHRALPDAEATARVVLRLLDLLNADRPDRNLQRWLLHRAGHPWADLLAPPPAQAPPLASTLPPLPPSREPPRLPGPFDPTEASAPLAEDGVLVRSSDRDHQPRQADGHRHSPAAGLVSSPGRDYQPQPDGDRRHPSAAGLVSPPGRRHRPQQEKMAREVANALAAERTALIEAPTGTGKTLAYLTPAAALARSGPRGEVTAGISTHTKVLQDQVVATLVELEETVGPFNWTVLKGAANYLSLPDLADELEELDEFDPADAWTLAVVAGWAARTPTGDWDDLNRWLLAERGGDFAALRWRVSCDDAPPVPSTELERLCFHRRAREAFSGADLAVVNHALLLSSALVADEITHLIGDEAHNFEDSATGALAEEVSRRSLHRLFEVLGGSPGRRRRRGLLIRYREYRRRSGLSPGGSGPVEEDLEAARGALENARARADDFGKKLRSYVLDRASVSREDLARYGAEYRIKPGLDVRSGEWQPVRRSGESLAAALTEIADRLDRLTVPAGPVGPANSTDSQARRRWRLETHIRRASQELRQAASRLRASVWAARPAEMVTVAELAPDLTDAPTGDPAVSDPATPRRSDDRAAAQSDDPTPAAGSAGREWALRRLPIDVSAKLRSLWESRQAVVLTSATLRVDGSFAHMADRLGVTAVNPLALSSPFEHMSQNQLVVLPGHLPLPSGSLLDEMGEAVAAELARLFVLAEGGGMGLFTARRRMLQSRDHLRPLLAGRGIEILCQGDQASMKLIEMMRDRPESCLLGTSSFWEGVDVPGEALRLLAIEKLPFPRFNDPLTAARMDAVELAGKDRFRDYLVPRAVLAFAQGAGRLIRTADDRGVLVVLDKRLRLPLSYTQAFLDALPGYDEGSVLRPASPEEGYEAIAEHLGRPWDDGVAAELDGLPPPAGGSHDFSDLRLDAAQRHDRSLIRERLEAVRERMGIAGWRPLQRELMEKILAGSGADVLAVLPTGSGKSLIYQIPAALLPGVTLVTSPLIALMRDQAEGMRRRGHRWVAALHSGQTQTEQNEILKGVRSGRYRLLYVSPERLWKTGFRQAMGDVEVSLVVVDEAHCVSQWGHNFRPEYLRISDAVTDIRGSGAGCPPIAALTATATSETLDDITAELGLELGDDGIVARSPDRPELHYYVEECESAEARRRRVLEVLRAFRDRPAIVYAPRRTDTEYFAGLLRADGHSALAYHGGMDAQLRTRTEEAFACGEAAVIVSTNAFGLGVDKPDVALVLHLEMPQSIEGYVQETGRAARGASDGTGPPVGTCVLLRHPGDCRIHQLFIGSAAPDIGVVRRVWESLPGRSRDTQAEMARRAGCDEDEVDPALLYLEIHGPVLRRPDAVRRCIVTVPGNWRDRMNAADWPPDRRSRLAEAVKEATRFGTEPFDLQRLGEGRWDVDETEALLFAADRDEILAVRVIEYAVAVDVDADREPDWDSIERSLTQQRERASERSQQAKAFARNRGDCRRNLMLAYLGADDVTEPCGACDVCDPGLPRPWQDHKITGEQMAEAVPVEPVIEALLRDLAGALYSRRNMLLALTGARSRYELPEELKSHRLHGCLAHCGRHRVEEALEGMIAAGKVEEVEVPADPDGGRAGYVSLRLR